MTTIINRNVVGLALVPLSPEIREAADAQLLMQCMLDAYVSNVMRRTKTVKLSFTARTKDPFTVDQKKLSQSTSAR